VNFQVRRWRLVLRVLVLALIVAAVPLPCLAGPGDQPAARPGLKASVGPAVRALAAGAPAPARVMKSQGTDARAQLGSRSFFRTGPGMAVIAILAAGTGYAIYSARHDRIHSTIPQGLQ
jgi:hypothetical protein